MKKILALMVAGLLIFTACASNEAPGKNEGKTYKVGTSVLNQTSFKDGAFEANVTYTSVALDADGKIAYVTIDAAQNKILVAADGTATFTAKGTKKEQKMDYGLNWFEQVAAFEKYAIGKTVQEIVDGDPATDLTSSVSIDVTGFVEGLKLAADNAVTVDNVVSVAQGSVVGAVFDKPELEINTTVAVVALDGDGKVVHTFIDESQMKATNDAGTVTLNDNLKTKGQLKEAYGMSVAGKVEWYLQVQTLTEWTLGKTAAEVAKVGDSADVTSKVSIYTGNFVQALEKAFANAK